MDETRDFVSPLVKSRHRLLDSYDVSCVEQDIMIKLAEMIQRS